MFERPPSSSETFFSALALSRTRPITVLSKFWDI
jgi:hypothetical protein